MSKRCPLSQQSVMFIMFLLSGTVFAGEPSADPASAPRPVWPPKGSPVRVKVTRDTHFGTVREEKYGSSGKSPTLKLKGQQESILFDIDIAPLKGRIITGALWHVRSQSAKNSPVARTGISSIASQWVEGDAGEMYGQVEGASCFMEAERKKRPWAYPGSTVMDVVFGRGHTIWKFAEATPPDDKGWQVCAVDADVVAARVAGLSYGFHVWDEVGNVWSIKDGTFKFTFFLNRMCHSSDSRGSEPWLEVWTSGTDTVPPAPVTAATVTTENLPSGEAIVKWVTPEDTGGGKTLGFNISYTVSGNRKTLPRYLIPMAKKAGEEVTMHIRDLPFKAGETLELAIVTVDSAGNISKPFAKKVKLSSTPAAMTIGTTTLKPFAPSTTLPSVAGLKVAVVDSLDKIQPQSGKIIPKHKPGYKGGNHLYSAAKKLIRLQAARNETVHFLVNLEGEGKDISLSLQFPQNQKLKPRVYESAYVNTKAGILPDPLLPLTKPFSIPSTAGSVTVPDQKNHSLLCEIYVPHDEAAGVRKGTLTISKDGKQLALTVELTIWNFTLPNKLSFVPEMNAYGTVDPRKSYDYYRLAHENRACINRLYYGWTGSPAFAPEWNGTSFSWAEWDKAFAPILDGSAFNDLPRKGEPVDAFYLPFCENWPVNIFEHYSPSYWADEAFTPAYKAELKKAFAEMAKHCNAKKWNDTIFEFYMNNKVYHRKTQNRNSAPWIFDEPVNTQDFWALRWYGILWHQAVEPVRGEAKMWYRNDISYSQFGRNMMWGVLDLEVLGGANPQKIRMKHDEQTFDGTSYFSAYGSANPVEAANTQPVAWSLLSWSRGATRILPWQTIAAPKDWKQGSKTALFYNHENKVVPSVRLKAFTRGQQDVEYLTLLGDSFGEPHYRVAAGLHTIIDLGAKVLKTHETDAGTIKFGRAMPEALWQTRCRVAEMVSQKAPKYKRSLVDWKTPKRDMSKLPDIGYVKVAPPKVKRYRPDCDSFTPK